MSLLQKNNVLEVSCAPLKDVAFEGVVFNGREALSELFTFTVIGRVSKRGVSFDKVMGKEASVILRVGGSSRVFHGCVGLIQQIETPLHPPRQNAFYKIVLCPLLGFLRHTRDCRIFQNLPTIDIITKVLKENNIVFKDETKQCGKKIREFCVQYNESHFDFVSRLMEEEGIFYFFIHSTFEHRMILADDLDAFRVLLPEEVNFERARQQFPQTDAMVEFKKIQQMVPQALSLKDFNFETPDKNLYVKRDHSNHVVQGEMYHYPGRYTKAEDGQDLVKFRLEAEEFQGLLFKGVSTIPALYPGGKFQLKQHPDPEMNQSYVVLEVEHRLELKNQGRENQGQGVVYDYSNGLTSFLSSKSYRPLQKTPKPRILSTQTALVTGKSGEEIWTEGYGRIKVKFHWDIHGPNDENSSCWIRVAYPWASHGWGFLSTPRVGMEVVVSYIDGDPDRPLVVGCVYNGLHKPPYLPQEATKSTFKSNSSKGGEGFNEFRFEDKKGEEEVYLHAQKNARTVIEDSRTTDIHKGSCTTTVHRGDRRVTLKGGAEPTSGKGDDILTLTKGSRTVELQAEEQGQGNVTTLLHRGDDTLLIKEGNQRITLEKGDQTIALRKGDREVRITGDDTLSISRGDLAIRVTSGNISIETTGNENHTVQGNMKLTVTGNLDIDATGSVKITGRRGVTINGSTGGVSVSGMTVKMDSISKMDLNATGLMNIKGLVINLN